MGELEYLFDWSDKTKRLRQIKYSKVNKIFETYTKWLFVKVPQWVKLLGFDSLSQSLTNNEAGANLKIIFC